MAEQDPYDLVVIGGGINGAGIAADAAGRGLSVLLVEADDLASATSSASSKLIHGGLRYLEHYEFRLVREALGERERLLAKAPHLIWPLRFVLPHVAGMRPDIALRAGLFLYDHLAPRRQLGASSALHLNADPAGRALKREYSRGYSYYDCWVDDARLVVANVLAAEAKGAHVLTRTPVIRLTAATPDTWAVELGPKDIPRTVRARAVVNAAGPWVSHVAGLALGGRRADVPKLRLIKGSHIVVPRLTATPDAYIFQNDDGRVVFALPFERDFTLIGTTDVAFTGDPRQVSVSAQEEAYLLAVAARFFVSPPGAADIVWKYAGVRPLEDDGAASASAISRDYHIALETDAGPPVVHVIGGKVTTYRRLAETVLETLQRFFPGATGPWTEREPLPGGEVGPGGFDAWFADFARGHPGFDRQYLLRLARRYGTRTQSLLEGARTIADLGADCGAGLSLREVEFLRSTEWARTADDILWRRTKTGLHVPAQQLRAVNERLTAALLGA